MWQRYWRPIVFFLFAASFLVSAPIVVLYTAGYRYHFDSGKIVQTGLISISSIPRGADMVMDGTRMPERTPAIIGNVIPGAHEIRVEKTGYTTWQKTLDVYSKQTSFAREVVLFLDMEPERFSPSVVGSPIPGAREWPFTPVEYTLQNAHDRTVLSRTGENGVASILAYLPLGTYTFEEAPSPYLLLRESARGRLILLDRSQTTAPILINTDATQWAWSLTGDALLLSDGFDIEVYVPTLHQRETLIRLSTPITGLAWYPLGRVVVYGNGGNVYAQELDRRGEPNTTTLLEGLEVEIFWFVEDGKWIVGTLGDGDGFRKRLQR